MRSCKEQGRELDEELEKGKLGIRESRRKQMRKMRMSVCGFLWKRSRGSGVHDVEILRRRNLDR